MTCARQDVDLAFSMAKRAPLIGISVGLIALTWLVFGQTLSHQFINYDDQTYVYENPIVRQGLSLRGIVWAFTHTVSHNWHPITIISHMIDCQLFGLKPGGHHFTNVTLHAATTVLLFLFLAEATGALWPSAFVAAVFAIHPLRAESVAWVAERKDVLSGLFFMLTLAAYLRYVRRSSPARYLIVALFFTAGLMCKSMLVSIPFVLLLLDYWPLRRGESWHRLVVEKIPLFAIAAIGSLITFLSQRGAIRPSDEFSLPMRISNAAVTIVHYLWEMVWPVRLAPFYPYPKDGIAGWELIMSIFLLAAITCLALARRHRGYLFTGWLWYVVMLLPVLGIVQVGLQAHADRYTYLPQIGLYVLITWFLVDLTASWPRRREILGLAAIMAIALLSWRAWHQVSFWRDSESLWTHTIAVTGENGLAETSLSDALIKSGRIEEAIPHGQEAIRIQPGSPDAHNNLGIALSRQGRLSEAVAHLQTTAALNPDRPKVHFNLATILLQDRQVDQAIDHFRKELEVQPHYAEAHNNLGIALSQKGEVKEAVAQWQQTLQSEPNNLDAQCNLAWVLATYPDASIRNGKQAAEYAQRAAELSHGKNPRILRLLAAAHAESGRFSEAIETAQRGLQLAIDQGDTRLADTLRSNIEQFRANSPLRDPAK